MVQREFTVNNATVDWLEAGGSLTNKTNAIITVDKSTLNGANANTDYDETQKAPQRSKYYARGSAIYLSYYDTGDNTIDIRNGSVLNGRILTGSAGKIVFRSATVRSTKAISTSPTRKTISPLP